MDMYEQNGQFAVNGKVFCRIIYACRSQESTRGTYLEMIWYERFHYTRIYLY